MSSYPSAFKLQKVGKLQHNHIASNKPIVLENNRVVPLNSTDKHLTTIHSQPNRAPSNLIQTNKVDFKTTTPTWSNSRGYGNIVIGTHDTCSNVHGRIVPYNRLPPLQEPYDTNVEVNDAWDFNPNQFNKCAVAVTPSSRRWTNTTSHIR